MNSGFPFPPLLQYRLSLYHCFRTVVPNGLASGSTMLSELVALSLEGVAGAGKDRQALGEFPA